MGDCLPHGPLVFPWKFGPCNSGLAKFGLDKDYYLISVRVRDQRNVRKDFWRAAGNISDEYLEGDHRWCRIDTTVQSGVVSSSRPVSQDEVFSENSQHHVVRMMYKKAMAASDPIWIDGPYMKRLCRT